MTAEKKRKPSVVPIRSTALGEIEMRDGRALIYAGGGAISWKVLGVA